MSSEDLKKWTTQVYKQSRSGIRYPEQDFLLSEPVIEVTDAHRKMPHLPLLSSDADLLAALLRRNQFLEEHNLWLSFSCSSAPEIVGLYWPTDGPPKCSSSSSASRSRTRSSNGSTPAGECGE
jgi:hypothetical protein